MQGGSAPALAGHCAFPRLPSLCPQAVARPECTEDVHFMAYKLSDFFLEKEEKIHF